MKNVASYWKGITALLITAVVFSAFSPTPTQAASNGQLLLTTSPLPINLHVTPGSSVTAPVKIKN
ncbi:MAG: hypothetical protein NTY33_02840, partial [Candidatus Moranbacteria bacterium]|nr:hypothetical protein [Candidatus Moranbacteria bacterium]